MKSDNDAGIPLQFKIQSYCRQVLVGCDGARSVVAHWMGRSEPRAVGQTAIRGVAEFKSGHQLEPRVEQVIGKGVRAGIVPISQNKVYWFVLFNKTASGNKLRLFYIHFPS